MSKKDKSQVEDGMNVEITEEAQVSEADKLEAFKASKREAAKRFKERRAAEKAERIEKAGKFIENMKSAGLWEQLSSEDQAFLVGLANPTSAVSAGGESTFKKLFGDNPAVGATITLREAFEKTLKGKSNLDANIKKWSEKGIVISFQENKDNILDSTYTIEALA